VPDTLRDAVARIRSALLVRPTAQRFDACAELVGGTEVTVRMGGRTFTVDEPRAAGGTDKGPNPIELALAALGSCQLITCQLHAARLGVRLESLRVLVEADLEMRPVFGIDTPRAPVGNSALRPTCPAEAIRLRVELAGPEPRERYEELHRLVENSCPVLAMTRGTVPVNAELVVNP
jgi:uncharacterized OsmC-like protein